MHWLTSLWRVQQLLIPVENRLEDYHPSGVTGFLLPVDSSEPLDENPRVMPPFLLRLTGSHQSSLGRNHMVETHKSSHSP